jgi:SSS family solute:Na+ symporter
VLFFLELAIMGVFAWMAPAAKSAPVTRSEIDLTPWRYTPHACVALLLAMVSIYLLFSPLGLAGTGA